MPNAQQTPAPQSLNGRVVAALIYAPKYDLRREMLGGITLRNPTAIKFAK